MCKASKDMLFKKICFIIFVTSLGFVCDVLLYRFIQNPGYLTSIGILTNLALFVLEILLETFVYHRRQTDIEKKEWFALCTVAMGGRVMLLIIEKDSSTSRTLCLICSFISLTINIIIFHFYDTLTLYYSNLLASQQAQLQLKLYDEKIKYMEASEEHIYSIQHDFRNHLCAIRSMVQIQDKQNILAYLEQFESSLSTEIFTHYTDNKNFNLLLNYLIDKVNSQGIENDIHIEIPQSFSFNQYDMNILLSNLIDNAIEAAVNSIEKKLSLHIQYVKGIFYMKITNSYNRPVLFHKNNYLTTKVEKDVHGYGLTNVKNIVKKYDGTIEFNHQNKIFVTKIYLYI